MINPANGNTKPMFVGQDDQIFMNEVFLKYLTAPTITSGGNPPTFSLTPDGRLSAKNADISGNVNANSGTLNNVTINQNCRILGKLSANQIEGDNGANNWTPTTSISDLLVVVMKKSTAGISIS
ncbi:host specificity protein [Shigella sonnei]|nr:host specificity protein [Shigella sonnei]